jgi:hypothetical protein
MERWEVRGGEGKKREEGGKLRWLAVVTPFSMFGTNKNALGEWDPRSKQSHVKLMVRIKSCWQIIYMIFFSIISRLCCCASCPTFLGASGASSFCHQRPQQRRLRRFGHQPSSRFRLLSLVVRVNWLRRPGRSLCFGALPAASGSTWDLQLCCCFESPASEF